MSLKVPRILRSDARCPACHRYYHNIDDHGNPIPKNGPKRPESALCQCRRGLDARAYNRQWRQEVVARRKAERARREDILSMSERNREYWERVRLAKAKEVSE